MSRTILNPEYANDLNGLFDGAGTSNISAGTFTTTIGGTSTFDAVLMAGDCTCNTTITSTAFILDGNGSTDTPTITTNVASNLVLSTVADSGITLSSPSGSATFTPGASGVSVDNSITAATFTTSVAGTSTFDDVLIAGVLNCDSTITADGVITAPSFTTSVGGTSTFDSVDIVDTLTCTTYAGGIGKLFVSSVGVAEIFAGTSIPFTYVIPNFVGNGTTTAYTISSNLQTGVAPGSQTTYFIWSVSFNSTDGQDTTVNVLVSNAGANTVGASTYNISIMAMN
jgi:hypothetical protein